MRHGRWVWLLGLLLAVNGVAAGQDLQAGFAEPLPEFSPVPIWWWSGDPVEREGVSEQVRKMAEGGIHNAIILNLAPSGPLYGSAPDEPPFLTEEWWDLFGFALGEAKKAGVRLWFYDQLGFSGAGLQARVVRDHPEYRGVELRREVREVAGPADVELPTPPLGTAIAAFVARPATDTAGPKPAEWIWDPAAPDSEVTRFFRREFDLDSVPADARINITCDNGYVLYVNGTELGRERISGEAGWGRAERFEVSKLLRPGRNAIAVEAINLVGVGGLVLEAVAGTAPDLKALATTNKDWRVTDAPADGWTQPGFDDAAWGEPRVLGAIPLAQWSNVIGLETAFVHRFGAPIADVRNVSDRIADGALRVSVPEGRHSVQLYYTTPGGFDYQNPAAGAALIDIVHGEMERRFAAELGKGIAGSFQDEFPALPHFSTRLPEEFKRRAGYDLLERLPALYDDVVDGFDDASVPTTAQIRCDANRVAAELCEEAFFIPLHEWHERYGMLCGYDQTVRNADPVRGEQYYVDYFRTMRHYSVPGNDMDGDIKPHQSIAELYGQPRVWIEAFHSSGWGQTLEEIATLLHPWYADGGTLFNPHAIYYSIHGSYWEWAPPDTGWRQPYFAHYPVLADYVSRLSWLLSQGTREVRVGVLHPASTVHAGTGFSGSSALAQEAQDAYWKVQGSLRSARMDYIILDEESVTRGEAADGILTTGPARLRVVILPAAQALTAEALNKLAVFAEMGGTVLVAGPAPSIAADRTVSEEAFQTRVKALMARATVLADANGAAEAVEAATDRDVKERLPYMRRHIGDRDFYFVLSDDGTPANGQARYAINDRELWKRPERLSVALQGDGMPEFWDALSGKVSPILNYRRGAPDGTRVDVDLAKTAAPLIALRPASPEEPLGIESDLDVTACERQGDAVTVRGLPRQGHNEAGEHWARVAYEDGVYEGKATAPAATRVALSGPFESRLEPTADNADGSFAWPPSPGPIPVETRSFRFREEAPGEDAAAWNRADFDDSGWETVLASFGPRAEWAGPVAGTIDTVLGPPADAGPFKPAVYSLKLGINEDPVFSSALGGKGRIPEDFLDLGDVKAEEVYLVRATVTLPADATKAVGAVLRIGGVAQKRAFLNGKEVPFQGPRHTRTLRAKVELRPGANRIELLASRQAAGRLRLFYQVLPETGSAPDPEWIWSAMPSPTGSTDFQTTVNLTEPAKKAEMVVALGTIHRIRINGRLLADQGNFDPYFTSRAERYDITGLLTPGRNVVQIEAHDDGTPVGLLLDGRVEQADGREVWFTSGPMFSATPTGGGKGLVRVLPGPAHGYMGDPANLLLRPRPHPLPEAGWLQDQPAPPAPFDRLVYAVDSEAPQPGWYRFLLPPGATKLHLRTPGEPRLFVDGAETPLRQEGGRASAELPAPDAPRRVAALRIAPVAGFEAGAALLEPVTFEVGPGRIPLGSWDVLGLPHYAGGLVYAATVSLPEAPAGPVTLDLGRARGSVDVRVNGVDCGTRLWHPYRFDLAPGAKAGENRIEIRVLNTLGPHFATGHPSAHVYKNHTVSGIFGPVTVDATAPIVITLSKTP